VIELSIMMMTLTIVIATVAVTIVAFRNHRIFTALMMDVEAVLGQRGEWWRIITSGLIHADYPHLMMNMLSLFLFGRWIEHAMGSWRFALIYIFGIVIGSFASLIVHRNNPSYRAVGASGGVTAIVGAATMLAPDAMMAVFPLPIPMPAWVVGCAFVVFSIVGSRWGGDNIGHEAHLGGTFAGISLTAAFFPDLIPYHWPYIAAMFASGAGAVVVSRRMMRGGGWRG
jgi:membrane associated rhomboid family serine protease